MGVSELQLVLFLHISKTDQLKDQRGLCSHDMKNLKKVARTHFIVSHRRRATPFTSESLKPPELTERWFASLFREALMLAGTTGEAAVLVSVGVVWTRADAPSHQRGEWGEAGVYSKCPWSLWRDPGFEWRFVSGEEMGNSCQLQRCCIDRGGDVLYLDRTPGLWSSLTSLPLTAPLRLQQNTHHTATTRLHLLVFSGVFNTRGTSVLYQAVRGWCSSPGPVSLHLLLLLPLSQLLSFPTACMKKWKGNQFWWITEAPFGSKGSWAEFGNHMASSARLGFSSRQDKKIQWRQQWPCPSHHPGSLFVLCLNSWSRMCTQVWVNMWYALICEQRTQDHAHTCVFVCICHLCACMCSMSVYVCTCAHACAWSCASCVLYVCSCVFVHMCLCVHASTCVYTCLYMCVHVCVCVVCACVVWLGCVWLSATLWTIALQFPLLGFSRQEYWNGLPFLPPGDLPDPGIKPTSPASPAL